MGGWQKLICLKIVSSSLKKMSFFLLLFVLTFCFASGRLCFNLVQSTPPEWTETDASVRSNMVAY